MTDGAEKSVGAFRTIGELSEDLGLPQHILRYWETRFPQLRPLQRAGKRRYYRPADVALVRRIDQLLNREGYTIKGVQKLLGERPAAHVDAPAAAAPVAPPSGMIAEMRRIRAALAVALAEDGR